jgi:hypothetical protein
MIMSYAAHRREFGSVVGHGPSQTETVHARTGIFRRIFNAFAELRQRDVDRQITRFLAGRSAERLTDELEREMFQRLSTSNWSSNASAYGERRFP